MIRTRIAAAALAAALALASCATVNRLDQVRLDDTRLAAVLQPPPEPSLDTWYNLSIDANDPIGTVLRVGSGIVKAAEAQKAGERMHEALSRVDVPAVVFEESTLRCSRALGSELVEDARGADLVLELEIEDYGIDAPSWSSAVALEIETTVRLFEGRTRDLVWRRHVTVTQRASPEVFGLPGAAESIFTAAMLASLSTEEMERGFAGLARYAARVIGDTLERDLWRAGGGW